MNVTRTQTLPAGVTITEFEYQDGTNDGSFAIREAADGRITSVFKYCADGSTIRVTQSGAPGVYASILGEYYDWKDAQAKATRDPEPMLARASIGMSIGFELNLVGGWEEDQIRALVTAKIDEALSTIETMLPEGGGDGEGSGFLVTDVHWNEITGWDIERR
jgi:hypothetical protein